MKTNKMKAKTVKSLQCESSGKDVAATLNEQYQGSIVCGDCGERFPTDNKVTVRVPVHPVPAQLRAFRRRLEKDTRSQQ
ncbi:hypothetical protein [Myxococcus phage Mx1]|nr:hypothetical protein [Myxococcus phage Mx1]